MTAPTRLRDRVLQTIREQSLWSPGDRVAVGVSGGLDSVVLLDLLLALRGAHGAQLSVVTVDHGTRADSAADADFVQKLAGTHGLSCVVARANLGPSASEATCRAARFDAFVSLDVDSVALAHHRDDQAETVVMRWLSGSGARGLAGMAFVRGRYVRPLLNEPRAALLAYAHARDLAWKDDESNEDPRFLRNRVRRDLLPMLESLRPGATSALARSARFSAEDDALLTELATSRCPMQEGGWRRQDLIDAPAPLARRSLLLGLPQACSGHIDAILAACHRGSGVVALSDAVAVRIHSDLVSVTTPP